MEMIVARIKQIAKDRGYNGDDFGKILGLKKSPWTDWKNGQSKPTLQQIIIICEKFAISSDYLLFGTSKSSDKLHDDEDIQELISNYCILDKRGQHRIHTIMYEELDRIKSESLNSKVSGSN